MNLDTKEWQNRKAFYNLLLTLWDLGLLKKGNSIMGNDANDYADKWGEK